MGLLNQDDLLKIHTALISAGLTDIRSALLAGIDPVFVATLPVTQPPGAQILSDLNALNNTEALADGCVPLRIWLKNALNLVGPRREGSVFLEVLASSPIPMDIDLQAPNPSTVLPRVLLRATALFKTGDKQKRIEADRLLERDAAAIDYDWLLSASSGPHGKHERAMLAKAIGFHPLRDRRGLDALLNMLAVSVADGGVCAYRVLTSLRKLLLEGLGGTNPMSGCDDAARCLAAIELLSLGTGKDTPAVANDIKILLQKSDSRTEPSTLDNL